MKSPPKEKPKPKPSVKAKVKKVTKVSISIFMKHEAESDCMVAGGSGEVKEAQARFVWFVLVIC